MLASRQCQKQKKTTGKFKWKGKPLPRAYTRPQTYHHHRHHYHTTHICKHAFTSKFRGGGGGRVQKNKKPRVRVSNNTRAFDHPTVVHIIIVSDASSSLILLREVITTSPSRSASPSRSLRKTSDEMSYYRREIVASSPTPTPRRDQKQQIHFQLVHEQMK